ncbi:MAG: LCP family protein [Chloroflexi bacterium]|nr:LCP family protein [Chloroflexota bacterium]
MTVLLVLNTLVLAWRLAAVLQAFFDSRHRIRPGRLGTFAIAALVVAVAAPHTLAHVWGSAAKSAFEKVFTGDVLGSGTEQEPAATGPGHDERLNMLILGIDKTPQRTATLTDTMMVVSIDPVGETVSMLSVPRDLVDVPLGDGTIYKAKLNSLYTYAETHPDDYPAGGIRALEDAIGALLQIRIHYYAMMDFQGFVTMINTLGGIDVNVTRGFSDPTYDGYGFHGTGWAINPGLHHFNGFEALAYARARKAATETDFTRAARQQEILIALRDEALKAGSLFFHLPELLETFGRYVRTDIPPDLLPTLAAVADSMDRDAIARAVLQRPYVKGGVDERGSIQRPDLELISELAAQLFTEPGVLPAALVTPAPPGGTGPGASPAASP